MKKTLFLSAMTALLMSMSGCSKSSSAKTDAQAIPEPTSPPVPGAVVPPSSPTTMAAQNPVPEVSRAIQNGQYDGAVQTLTQLQPTTAQMTEAQRLQYQQALRDATTALLQAKDRDPAAKAAYEKLSRVATGR